MELKLTDSDLIKLKKLIKTKNNNIAVAELFNEIFNNNIIFDNADNIDDVSSSIANIFGMNLNDKETLEIFEDQIKKSIQKTSTLKYENNSYKSAVKPKEISKSNIKLAYLKYIPKTLIPLDDIKVNEKDYYKEYSSIGFIENEYSYLSLIKNQKIWMCIIPNEIKTMEPYLEKCNGQIITFGLGLGYFVFMAANCPEVEKVTVVENDLEVINLFNTYIFPFFPNKEKIHIIADDAFSYLKKNPKLIGYNYAFFDLWHNAEDGLPIYLKLISMDFNCDCGYWLEKSIVALYRRCFITLLEENLEGYKETNYKYAKSKIDAVINALYYKTKDLILKSFDEINGFCDDNNLKQFMKLRK